MPTSLQEVVDLFGDPSADRMSDYYRNGGLVPNEVSEFVIGDYGLSSYSRGNVHWVVFEQGGATLLVGGSTYSLNESDTSLLVGTTRYQRNALQETDGFFPSREYYYSIRSRTEGNVVTPINQDVPTSGELRLSDFATATNP